MVMTGSESAQWFVSTVPRPAAELVVVAFPHAGAGCSAFVRHARAVPEWLEFMTLNLPGRQARFSEPPRTDLDELVDELAGECARLIRPYLFFGYCSGALLAYCVARRLYLLHAPMPKRLLVGSFKAPHLAIADNSLAELDSERLWQTLVENQAVPSGLASNVELKRLSEPALRADFALISGYKHTPGVSLPVPITALAGRGDRWAMEDGGIAAWEAYTSQGFDMRWLPAGHWFMEEDPPGTVSVLEAEAARVRARHSL